MTVTAKTAEPMTTDPSRGPVLYPDLQRALQRVGRAPDAQARWLLGFAQSNLKQLSRDDWLNRWSETLAFALVEEGALPFALFLPGPQVLRRWQAVVRRGLGVIAAGRSWPITLGPQRYELQLRRDVLTAGRVWKAEGFWAHLRQAFLAAVVRTLGTVGTRFRLCQRCRRPFIKRKRQTYCTSKCSQLVRTHKYRRAHRERLRARRRKMGRERPSG